MKSEWQEIFDILNVPPEVILIQKIQLFQLGRTLQVDCLYHLDDLKSFTLTFNKCKRVVWELIDEDGIDHPLNQGDVIRMYLGIDNYQEELAIHADMFAVMALYESKSIHKDW